MQVAQNEFIDVSKDDKNKPSRVSFFSQNQRMPQSVDILEIGREMEAVACEMRNTKNKKFEHTTQKMQQKKLEQSNCHKDKLVLKAEKIALLEREKKLMDEIEELKLSIKNLELVLQSSSKKQAGVCDESLDLNQLCEDFIIGTDLNSLRAEYDKKSKKIKQIYTQSALKSNLEEVQSNYDQYLKLKKEIEDEIAALNIKVSNIETDITNLMNEIDKINKTIADSMEKLNQDKLEVTKCEAVVKEQCDNKENSNKTYEKKVGEICKNHEATYVQKLTEYETDIKKADEKYELDVNNAKWYRDENIGKKNKEISSLQEKIDQNDDFFPVARRFHHSDDHRNHFISNNGRMSRPQRVIESMKNAIKNKKNDIEEIKKKCDQDIDSFGVSRNEKRNSIGLKIDELKKNKDPELKQLLKDAQSAHENLKTEIDKKIKNAELNLKNVLNTVAETENIIRLAEISLNTSRNYLKQNQTEKKQTQDMVANKNQILEKIQEKIAMCAEKINALNNENGLLQTNDVINDADSDFLDLDENLCAQTFDEISAKRKRLCMAEQELYSLKITLKKLVFPQDEASEIPLITAVIKGDEEMVTVLLKLGVDPNLKDQYGWTALHCAVAKLHPENRATYEKIIIELVANGADLSETNGEGLTVQELAIVDGIDSILTKPSNNV